MNHTVRNALLTAAAAASAPTALAAQDRDGWYINEAQDLALIEGNPSQSGALLGVQCDRNDPRARRLVFGAVRKRDRDGLLREISALRPAVLRIAVESQSAYAEFLVELEDKAQLDISGTADVVAAYLTKEQFALIRSARSVTVRVGENQAYWFTGNGSASATGALPCAATPQILASRIIPSRPDDAPVRPIQTSWSFTPRLLAADPTKGRYIAGTSTVGFPESPLASFNFEITCHGNRLHAAFTNGSVANSVAMNRAFDPAKFQTLVNTSDNFAEIYRAGRQIARFPVEPGSSGKGHVLTSQELSALLSFDRIVVSSAKQARTIEFTAEGGPQAISSIAQACGASQR